MLEEYLDVFECLSAVCVQMMLEEYLDGTEVDCDVVLSDGEAVYAKVTDNWPTVEPWFNETGDNAPSLLPADQVRIDGQNVIKRYVATVPKRVARSSQGAGGSVRGHAQVPRLQDGRLPRGGQVHLARAAADRGEQPHGGGAGARQQPGGVGGGPGGRVPAGGGGDPQRAIHHGHATHLPLRALLQRAALRGDGARRLLGRGKIPAPCNSKHPSLQRVIASAPPYNVLYEEPLLTTCYMKSPALTYKMLYEEQPLLTTCYMKSPALTYKVLYEEQPLLTTCYMKSSPSVKHVT
eukprot:1177581-Prorocentrum_minimum.AAC.1